jgi:hypothetical protein
MARKVPRPSFLFGRNRVRTSFIFRRSWQSNNRRALVQIQWTRWLQRVVEEAEMERQEKANGNKQKK